MQRIIFFGTSNFSAEILEFLIQKKISIVAIVTQPDRGGVHFNKLIAPVKKVSLKKLAHIPLLQPEKASDPHFIEMLRKTKADLFVVVGYGRILKQIVLDLPKKGCINIHASLLPLYRGAAPIRRCLMAGDKKTGITIMKMVAEMDAGPILAMDQIDIDEDMTFGELEKNLCELAKPLIYRIIQEYEAKIPIGVDQDESLVTFAPKIISEDREIDWKKEAIVLHNQIRAFSPSPGAFCWIEIKEKRSRLKILQSKVLLSHRGVPGEILEPSKERLIVSCGKGAIEIFQLQLEGKKMMNTSEFLRGLHGPLKFII